MANWLKEIVKRKERVNRSLENKKRKPIKCFFRFLRCLFYPSSVVGEKISTNAVSEAPIDDAFDYVEEDIPHLIKLHQDNTRFSILKTSTEESGEGSIAVIECSICLIKFPFEEFCELKACGHRFCISCMQTYVRLKITEYKVSISCPKPKCAESLHPNEICRILNDNDLIETYHYVTVMQILAEEPNTRYCPAPDCKYIVIANNCASCPKIKCEGPGCSSYFCYHCKSEWHSNNVYCDEAQFERLPNKRFCKPLYHENTMDKKPWSRKKKILWHLGNSFTHNGRFSCWSTLMLLVCVYAVVHVGRMKFVPITASSNGTNIYCFYKTCLVSKVNQDNSFYADVSSRRNVFFSSKWKLI